MTSDQVLLVDAAYTMHTSGCEREDTGSKCYRGVAVNGAVEGEINPCHYFCFQDAIKQAHILHIHICCI